MRLTGLFTLAALGTHGVLAQGCAKTYEFCGNHLSSRCCEAGAYCQPWEPYKYQCIPVGTGCSGMETDIDYYGHDIADFKMVHPGDCCATCQQTEGCTHFSFNNQDPRGPWCFLKSSGAGRRVAKGIVSGRRNEPTCAAVPNGPCGMLNGAKCCPKDHYCQPWSTTRDECMATTAGCGDYETNVDYWGNDVDRITNVSPAECCQRCQAHPECKFFSYNPQEGGSVRACYLKTSDAGRYERPGMVSGRRTAPFPVPTPTPTPDTTTCEVPLKHMFYHSFKLEELALDTQEECCNACAANPRCKLYTHVRNKRGEPAGKCILRWRAGRRTNMADNRHLVVASAFVKRG